ncbi:uncharacterized protein LOC105938203 isoform X2 [Fundulus heteroclitus]|uniref:uncharacterized protein LOC105938203 isoform X2 n=1 Tax=Fundulus heteroclitus TaxID=8078 RepID=UPI00165B69CC|nr:uncharacterized protein LOC105938203 isoform X2 [Fundulus heteroclitus]
MCYHGPIILGFLAVHAFRGLHLLSSSNWNNPAQSGSEPPQHRESPSDIFPGQGSFVNPNAVAAVDASNSPTQDLAFFSKKGDRSAPLGYRSKVHKTKYTPTFSSGFPKVGQPHVLPPPKAPSLNYFIPFNQIYVPNYDGKNKKKKSKSFHHAYKASRGKKSKDGCYLPPSLEKASAESSSNSKYVFPHLGLKANVPQKERDGSHLAFTVKPSSPLRGSTGHSGYLGYQTLHSDPFMLAANPEYKKKTFHFEPKEKPFPQQNLIHKESSPQAHLGSFSAQDRFLFLNGGYKDAVKAGLLKPISQPINFASWPQALLSEHKDPDMNCIIWKNTQSSSQPRSRNSSRSSLNAFKLKNRSTRATTILSRACYKPSQMTLKWQWKPALR